MKEQYCISCGNRITNRNELYCSDECEQNHRVRARHKLRIKQKSVRKLSLDEQARQAGMTYAEYTTKMILASLPPIDLNIGSNNGGHKERTSANHTEEKNV